MVKATGHILKSSNVKLEGKFYLDIANERQSSLKKNAVSSKPQVHILENHPDFAVIEITCTCGTKTSLKCEYSSKKPSVENCKTETQVPNKASENAEQTK